MRRERGLGLGFKALLIASLSSAGLLVAVPTLIASALFEYPTLLATLVYLLVLGNFMGTALCALGYFAVRVRRGGRIAVVPIAVHAAAVLALVVLPPLAGKLAFESRRDARMRIVERVGVGEAASTSGRHDVSFGGEVLVRRRGAQFDVFFFTYREWDDYTGYVYASDDQAAATMAAFVDRMEPHWFSVSGSSVAPWPPGE